MCVIAYKAKDVRFMSNQRIEDMWESNPDGAGIMWRDNETNKIKFIKGFMKLNKLMKWVNKNRSWLDSVELAMHFRITTHGGTSKGNCHPFVCDCDVDSHLLQGEADFVLMHNGVLPIKPRKADISDSAELALRIGRYADPMDVMDICDELYTGNRIIIMGKEGTMMYGDAWKNPYNDGVLYSNDLFGYDDWGYGSLFGYRRTAKIGSSSKGAVKLGDVTESVFDKMVSSDSNCASFKWNETKAYWYNTLRPNVPVDLFDVDPDCLSSEDYDEYLGQMEDYSEYQAYDPELVEEAHAYGMSVEDYLNCKNGDDWCPNKEVEEVM